MSTHHHHKEDGTSLSPGTILQNRWEIIKLIGRGSFSEIFVARDTTLDSSHPAHMVAIKAQLKSFENALNIMKWESSVMQSMRDVSTVPKIFGTGDHEGTYYFAMEILTGEDMSKLRNRIRDANPTRLVPINIASYLARQMLSNLREIHRKGYVHRDVKPSNFVRKDKQSNQFYTIDFGLAKSYREANGSLRKTTGQAEFRGTTMYASPFAHHGLHQCPRDDLLSVLHVFLDLVCGFLPWGVDARGKDKTKVIASKNQCYDDLDTFIAQEVRATRAVEELHSIPASASNFPSIAQEKVLELLNYMKFLQYESDVDYDKIDKLFAECVPAEMDNNVADINFKSKCFRWIEENGDRHMQSWTLPSRKRVISSADSSEGKVPQPTQPPPPPPAPPVMVDPVGVAVRNLTTRVTNIQQTPRTPRPDSHISLDQHIASMATRWRHCFSELQKIPSERITNELLVTFDLILKQYANFFAMHVSNWADFEALQLEIMRFYDMQRAARQQTSAVTEEGPTISSKTS